MKKHEETVDALIMAIRSFMKDMDDDERIDLIHELMKGYCEVCGSPYLPCYCLRDD
jgi:hypothetical protein